MVNVRPRVVTLNGFIRYRVKKDRHGRIRIEIVADRSDEDAIRTAFRNFLADLVTGAHEDRDNQSV